MAETRDKRRRTDLDLFILALIDSGVSTPYAFQKAAGLSQGATIPALHRLLEARLVRLGKPGSRGRTDYRVTAAGKLYMRTSYRARPTFQRRHGGSADYRDVFRSCR